MRQERPTKHYTRTAIPIAVLAAMVVFILAYCCGCGTPRYVRKTDKAVTKLFTKDSVIAIGTLQKYLPVTVDSSSKKDTSAPIPGPIVITDSTTRADTIYHGDSTIITITNTITKKQSLYYYITAKYFFKDHSEAVALRRDIAGKTDQLLKAEKDRDKYKDKVYGRVWYMWAFWIIVGVIVAGSILLVYLHQQGKVFDFASKMGRNG